MKGKPDSEIDYSDIPQQTDLSMFRPIKKAISFRIDADILEWLKSGGGGYQTRINDLLREAMNREDPDFRRRLITGRMSAE